MTMSHLKHKECETTQTNSDATEYRQLAAIIVDNLLTRAITKANEHIVQLRASQMNVTPKYNETNLDSFGPDIQIDLVGTRTPSPEEEELIDWSYNKKEYKFKAPIDQQSASFDTDFSINDFEITERDVDSITNSRFDVSSKIIELDDMRDFATEYIKTIVSSALETLNSQPIDIDKCLIKTSRSDNQCFESGAWMSRIRQVFTRLMRSACLCKSKHQFRHRKS